MLNEKYNKILTAMLDVAELNESINSKVLDNINDQLNAHKKSAKTKMKPKRSKSQSHKKKISADKSESYLLSHSDKLNSKKDDILRSTASRKSIFVFKKLYENLGHVQKDSFKLKMKPAKYEEVKQVSTEK